MAKDSFKKRITENSKMLSEIFKLIVENKKWWLMPIFMVFGLLSFFAVLAGGNSILPAIYALF